MIAGNTSALVKAFGEPVGMTGLSAEDRRTKIRFSIELDLTIRFRTQSFEITGKTVNISSSGILIRTAWFAPPGKKVKLALAWPQLLDNRIPLCWSVHARVVRAGDGLVAVTIERSEFRTRRVSAASMTA